MIELTPPDPAIDVTVCIVNWNGAQWLPGCLRSLREAGGLQLQVIVVDNASGDGSVDLVRTEFSEVELIVNSENVGFAKGNNQAIRKGLGRAFLLLNNDTIVEKGAIEQLVRSLDEHPRAGVVGGHLVNPDGSTQFKYYHVTLPSLASLAADLFWLNRIWPRNRLGRGPLARRWDPGRPYQMEQIPAACMLLRRTALESFGLFDEGYAFLYEDVDLCARCRRAGWEIWYEPMARVFHYGSASSKRLDIATRSLWRFRSMLRYARHYLSGGHFFMLKLLVGLVLLLRLPIVVAASLWPSANMKRIWEGGGKAHLRLLEELLHAPEARGA
jgi:N-acetylglucosaminyl-diphospho-decaprenol L-rhamnosyltransferase